MCFNEFFVSVPSLSFSGCFLRRRKGGVRPGEDYLIFWKPDKLTPGHLTIMIGEEGQAPDRRQERPLRRPQGWREQDQLPGWVLRKFGKIFHSCLQGPICGLRREPFVELWSTLPNGAAWGPFSSTWGAYNRYLSSNYLTIKSQVFDFDAGSEDDFLGQTSLEISSVVENGPFEVTC